MNALTKQHLIDPEICIRCNTCEATCPIGAITHDANNYVVDASICNFCMDCVSPCPTGSIDNWFTVNDPYSLEDQFSWLELPPKPPEAPQNSDALDAEVEALFDAAHEGAGVPSLPKTLSLVPQLAQANVDVNDIVKNVLAHFQYLPPASARPWTTRPFGGLNAGL